jgi:AmiR/NasT family two-component response regulator
MDELEREYPNVVHQAAGMISVQCDCSIREAIVRMNLRAHAAQLTIEDIAEAVVDRGIRFD